MLYYFVINGRGDKPQIREDLDRMLEGCDVNAQFYVTRGTGDATRFVNLYCDLNPRAEVCFVACGGAGTTNEVASGLVGRDNKYLAILNFHGTNDYIKYYPERDFHDFKAILEGEKKKVDIIKANDNYALNVIDFGMGSEAANMANQNIKRGVSNPYNKAVLQSLLFHRYNRLIVTADGERLNKRAILLGTLSNGKYSGSKYLTAPYAVDDDGLMEVLIMKPTLLVFVAIVIKKYEVGLHLEDKFCARFFKYRRAKHVELKSKDLIYLCLDGEIFASRSYKVDIIEKAITIILPKAR